ncbi:AAA family ATPase [Kineococcus arenarius]|uniref:AAA family ATPase n=1 Tax=Kineococcus sp. SYSU DK007 TaxID=3383128 RepID=UPI003D7D48CD
MSVPLVPVLPDDVDALTAATAYAAGGLCVLPLAAGSKSPGSVVGTGWPRKSSRSADQLAAWYAGTCHGVGIDTGASGLVVFDVDHPAVVPEALRRAVAELDPPRQSTRRDDLERGHVLFTQPPGRLIGNSPGHLGSGWGDVRGVGGFIVAAPSTHPDARGRYRWQRTGPVPPLPDYLADLLPDAGGVGAQSLQEVTSAPQEAAGADRSEPLDHDRADAYVSAVRAGELARLDRCQREGWGTHWDATTFEVACNLIELANGPWNSYTLQAAHADVLAHAPHDGAGFGPREHAAKWRSALRRVGERARALPAGEYLAPALPDFDPSTGEVLDAPGPPAPRARRLRLTPASAIPVHPVYWLWSGRLAVGTLALIAGPEGLGKSTLAYYLVARVTRGELEGAFHGRPRGVLVCATEDSWSHTVVPRLIAAGADLDRVFRVEVRSADEVDVGLSLPRDLDEVEEAAHQTDAALLLLDPLMSRLASTLDTHRDAETRRALEPLAALADRAGVVVAGLIHHNKGGSADPLTAVMGSKAFTAVARSVHTVVRDPDDETEARRLFGTPKNNLGRTDLPVLAFTITGHRVVIDDEHTVETSRLDWQGEAVGTIREAMSRAATVDEDRSVTTEAAEWLEDYLASQGGEADKADVLRAGRASGHSEAALRRARERVGVIHRRRPGFQAGTVWRLPVPTTSPQAPHSRTPVRGEDTSSTTSTTGFDLRERGRPLMPTNATRATPETSQAQGDASASPGPDDLVLLLGDHPQ